MRRPGLQLARLVVTLAALGAGALSVTTVAQQPEQPPAGSRLFAPQPAAGSRMMVLLIDVGSISPEDLLRVAGSGIRYVDEVMSGSDVMSIVRLGSRLEVLADFTSDRTQLKAALGSLTGGDGAAGDVGNDVRLRALRTLCETLAPIQQKKAVLYFSSGMQRIGGDNSVELRETTSTCNLANVSLYPVDARGLPVTRGQAL